MGAPYRYAIDGTRRRDAGEVVEVDPPKRLVLSFRALFDDDTAAEPASRVTWEITPLGSVCRLTCVHTDLFGAPKTWAATADGWNVVLNGMKTLLETGDALGEIPDDGGVAVRLGDSTRRAVAPLARRSSATTAPTTCSSGRIAPTAETETMIDMAHAAKYHWGKVGTPVNQVRGDYLCSRVYAFVGRAEPALHHARRAVAEAEALGLADFDLAFVHEATCTRARVRGRRRRCQKRARRRLERSRSPIAEDREIFDADLAKEPWYGVRI